MRRRVPKPSPPAAAQVFIHLLERSEEAGERVADPGRAAAHLVEIAAAELVGDRDYCCSHRSIFVRPLRPGRALLDVQPERKSHESSGPQSASSIRRSKYLHIHVALSPENGILGACSRAASAVISMKSISVGVVIYVLIIDGGRV